MLFLPVPLALFVGLTPLSLQLMLPSPAPLSLLQMPLSLSLSEGSPMLTFFIAVWLTVPLVCCVSSMICLRPASLDPATPVCQPKSPGLFPVVSLPSSQWR